MNILLVYAHPEPNSLNGALKDFTVDRLEQAGHTVTVSDLYAMQWKAPVDARDTTSRVSTARFNVALESRHAFEHGFQAQDIAGEQEKLQWADAVILQFPLWWYSMPAILKGWVERVYAYGFAYGVGEHSDTHWGDRFGEGKLAGKRAMLTVTAGGWESHYGPRGINGPIDDVLYPIQHGVLYYPGFDVMPPFVVYRADSTDRTRLARIHDELGQRLDTLFTADPIAFRPQNAGDYDIPALTLRADILPGQTGMSVHISDRKPGNTDASDHANKLLIDAFLGHFEKRGVKQLLDMMSDDATWWVNGKPHLFPFAGLKTKAEMESVLGGLFALFEGGLKMELQGMVGEGDLVAAQARSQGVTKTGKSYENEYHLLFRLRDGKIVEVREYTDPMHAVEVLADASR